MSSSLCRLAMGGMRGRKRDTRALALVMTCAFLFLTLAGTLMVSLSRSQARQREALYGSWQVLYDGRSREMARALREQLPDAAQETEILGLSEQCGMVAVYDEDFFRRGSIRLQEGRAPEGPDEIVLEAGRLGSLREDAALGSKITLSFSWSWDVNSNTDNGYQGYIHPLGEVQLDQVASRWWWQLQMGQVGSPEYYLSEMDLLDQYLPENGLGLGLPMYDQLTEEQKEQVRRFAVAATTTSYTRTTNEGQVWEGYNWRLYTDLVCRYVAGIYELYPDWDMGDDAISNGTPVNQQFTVQRIMTVVGIADTYSDRWDCDSTALPNAFVAADFATGLHTLQEQMTSSFLEPFSAGERTLLLLGDGSRDTAEVYTRAAEAYEDASARLPAAKYTYEMLERDDEITELFLVDNPRQLREEWGVRFGRIFARNVKTGQTEALGFEYRESSVRLYGAEVQVYLPDLGQVSVEWEKFFNGDFDLPGYEPVSVRESLDSVELAYERNTGGLRINRMAYPLEAGLDHTMTLMVMGVIVIFAACAVCQIFLTQMKRRTRKLMLLKSIGAVNGQILGMLAWEGLILLAFSVPVGTAAGLGLARAVVAVLAARSGGEELFFAVDWGTLGLGLALGVLSAALGMLLPAIRAVRTPLTGRMNVRPPRRRRVRGGGKFQTFGRICLRDVRVNWGRTLGTFLLCLLLILMQLLCVFLANGSFADYRASVVRSDKPDYVMTANYSMSSRNLDQAVELLREADGLERLDVIRMGEHVHLWYDGMEDSPILQALQTAGETVFFEAPEEGAGISRDDPGYLTRLYAFSKGSGLLERLCGAVTEGSVNMDALLAGEEIILAVPLYAPGDGSHAVDREELAAVESGAQPEKALSMSGGMTLSMDRSDAPVCEWDRSVQPGMNITLAGRNQEMDTTAMTSVIRWKERTVRVGGILRYFPDEGVWPFSGEKYPFAVICGDKLLTGVYPAAFSTMSQDQARDFRTTQPLFYPYCYGQTIFQAYVDSGAGQGETLTPLLRAARAYSMPLYNYRDSNSAVYTRALSNGMFLGLLGTAVSVIVLMILGNSLASAQEQSRRKTGVLQALGVSRRQLYLAQGVQGLAHSLLALLAANLALACVILCVGAASRAGLRFGPAELAESLSGRELWHYPWWAHGALCALLPPAVWVLHRRALREPLRRTPIENIRG